MKKGVLIVEDDDVVQRMLLPFFKQEGFEPLFVAGNFDDAIRQFEENQGIIIGVSVDGCLNTQNIPDGIDVVKSLRSAGFTGPIVAASTSDDLNNLLVEEGVTAKLPSVNYRAQKERAARVLARLVTMAQ